MSFKKSVVLEKLKNPLHDYMQETNEKIRENFPKLGFHQAFCGGTQSGKTFIAQCMLLDVYKDIFDQIYIFTPNKLLKYEDIFDIPEENVFRDFTFETVKELYDIVVENFEAEGGRTSTLFLFDDCGTRFSKWGPKGDHFTDMLSEVRHANVTVWVLEQYCRYLTRPMRANILAYVVFPTLSPEEYESLGEATIGKKLMVQYMSIVRQENKDSDNKYGALYWCRKGRDFKQGFYLDCEEDGVKLYPITDE